MYAPGDPVVCLEILGQGKGFCVFSEGRNVPQEGVSIGLVLTKLWELENHGCFACGYVPIAPDNNPDTLGVVKVDFLNPDRCYRVGGNVACQSRLDPLANTGIQKMEGGGVKTENPAAA